MKKLQRCGIIIRTIGLKGHVIVETDNYKGIFEKGEEVYIGLSTQFTESKNVKESKIHGNNLQISFEGYETKEHAQELIGKALYADADKKTGNYSEEYLVDDIIGCEVISEHSISIGTVSDVWTLPANDVWVITTVNNGEILLPVIDDTVKNIDIVNKKIIVVLMEEIEGDE